MKKKNSWLYVLLVGISISLSAQELPVAWQNSFLPVNSISGVSPAYQLTEMKMDALGNTYVVGYFRGTADFNPGSAFTNLISFSATIYDGFIAKYNSSGNLVFVKQITGSGEIVCSDLAITNSGQIVVVGRFNNEANFDPGFTNHTLFSDGGSDGFIARFDAETGSFQSAGQIGGVSNDALGLVTSTPSSEYYVRGYFAGIADLDAGTANVEYFAQNTQDQFIAKYSSSFDLIWAKQFSSTAQVGSIAADATGIVASGMFSGTADFETDTGPVQKSSLGLSDIWLTKFDADGSALWNVTFGGLSTDVPTKIVLDGSSAVYVSGYFSLTVDFNPGPGIATATSNGVTDMFVSKFDASGSHQWVRTIGGTHSDFARYLALLQDGRIVVGGDFLSPTLDADPGPGVYLLTNQNSSATTYDAMNWLLGSDGSFIGAFSYGTASYNETAGLVATNDITYRVSGNFQGNVDVDPTADINNLLNPNISFQQGYLLYYTLLDPVPSAQPSALVFSGQTSSSIDVSFTPAAGTDGYIVLRRPNSATSATPKDGRNYFPGDFIGNAIVAFSGPSASFTDFNLAADQSYSYSIFSYNNSTAGINYLTTAPLTGSSSTLTLTPTRTTDSLALVAIYASANGPGWTNSTNWLTGAINTWYGVTVTANRVTAIDLGSNQLSGVLPPAIGNLTALTSFEVYFNQLTGPVPPEIGNLTSLTYIDLAPNEFTGNIPPEIGNLTGLTTLWLNDNNFDGPIPSELANLTALNNLYLQANQLTGSIPPEFGNLTALTLLQIQSNQLTGPIPSQLGNLSNLEILRLDANQLSGSIPVELGGLANLQEMNLSLNQLNGSVPLELANLLALTSLNLSYNQLSGEVLQQYGGMTNLVQLRLAGNQFSGSVPPELTLASSLQTIDLGSNLLTDLPDMSSMAALANLLVSGNYLTFEDLEPNITKFSSSTNYSPQKTIGVADTLFLNAGASLSLPYTVGGTANIYLWKKNNVNSPGDNTNTLSRPSVALIDEGNWQLTITNSIVTGLTLTTAIVRVKVTAEGMFTWANGGDLTADGSGASLYSGAWGDYDNDGFEDIYTLGIGDFVSGKLYHNNGDGTFTRNNLIEFADGRSATWGDYNNDGFLDLFVPDFGFAVAYTDGISQIFKNNGNGTFTKIQLTTDAASGTWADFDNDGDLDISIANGGTTEIFLENKGNDVFTQFDANVNNNGQWNNIWFHANGDDQIDFLIPSPASDQNSVKVYLNEGDNYFTEIPGGIPTLGGATRGVSVADIDNDGDFDLYVMLSSGTENFFFINDGDGVFTQELCSVRLGQVVVGGRASAFGDLNNDGYVDLVTYLNTPIPAGVAVFLNNGNGTFTRQTNQTFKDSDVLSGLSIADYNNDGFLDIFSATFNAGVTNGLYRNIGNGNNWLKIKLTGTSSNRNAIGARVSVKAGGFWRHNQVLTANGFANQNSLIAHFGLASSSTIDSLVIVWPSGRKQFLTAVAGNQLLQLTEPGNPQADIDLELLAAYQLRALDSDGFINAYLGAIDHNDNMITAGFYTGEVDLDPGAAETLVTSSGDEENYLAKFDGNGTLLWHYVFPNTYPNYINFNGITTDASGNIIIAGEVKGTIDVDPGPGVTTVTVSHGGSDPLISKLDPSGNLIWAKQLTFTPVSGDNAESNQTLVDNAGNIIVVGEFDAGTLDLDPGPGTTNISTTDDAQDMFIAKYDVDGNYVWGTKFGVDDVYEISGGMAVDSQNNIYLIYSEDDGDQGTHLVKYSPTGNLIWSVNCTFTFSGYTPDAISIDEANNRIFVAGGYESIPIFSGTSGSGSLPASAPGVSNGFVASFDLDGVFINAFAFVGSEDVEVYSILKLPDNSLLVGGYYEGTIDLDPTLNTFEHFSGEGSWMAKVTTSGDFLWGASVDKSEGFTFRLNNQGQLIGLLVAFNGTVDVDPSAAVQNLSAIQEDAAILKFNIGGGVPASHIQILQDFYNATGGPNWTNKTNWLSGDVGTWYGLTLVGNQIRSIQLPNNNLTGDVPPDVVNLTHLQTLDLAANKIQNIPDLTPLSSLTSLKLENNKLGFDDLEANVSIAGISYIPQDTVSVFASVLKQLTESHTFTSTIGGTANQYQWKKDGVPISGATSADLSITNISLDDDAIYTFDATNTIVTGLTLSSAKKLLRVSSLRRDSIALRSLYNLTGGPNWTNKANWLTTPLSTGNWFGITITNNRVTGINLSNNNLSNSVPGAIADISNLTTLNLSSNKLISIPDLTALENLTALNVSSNNLDFSSLENNAEIIGINYVNQGLLGTASTTLIDVGTNYEVSVSGGGSSTQYQWRRNGANVNLATGNKYTIQSIGRNNMGDYDCVVTNTKVPGLVLSSARQTVLATATIGGRLLINPIDAATKGKMTMFRIRSTGAYDTTAVQAINTDGTYQFTKIVLDDYQLLGFADTISHVGAIPTYYKKTIYWEEADTLVVVENLSQLDIVSEFRPSPPKDGQGEISGIFSEEVPDGRILKNKRVSSAGASLRRVERTGRGKDIILTLIAYTFTNEEGEFVFPKLDPGEYRLNLQYPGYPMDETSFIDIVVGTGLFDKQVGVDAQVKDGKIVVTKRVITGWEESDSPFVAYPNPAENWIRLKNKYRPSQRITIALMDSNGRSINLPVTYLFDEDEWLIDVASLPFGVYIINVSDATNTYQLKMIVEP